MSLNKGAKVFLNSMHVLFQQKDEKFIRPNKNKHKKQSINICLGSSGFFRFLKLYTGCSTNPPEA